MKNIDNMFSKNEIKKNQYISIVNNKEKYEKERKNFCFSEYRKLKIKSHCVCGVKKKKEIELFLDCLKNK